METTIRVRVKGFGLVYGLRFRVYTASQSPTSKAAPVCPRASRTEP